MRSRRKPVDGEACNQFQFRASGRMRGRCKPEVCKEGRKGGVGSGSRTSRGAQKGFTTHPVVHAGDLAVEPVAVEERILRQRRACERGRGTHARERKSRVEPISDVAMPFEYSQTSRG